MISWFRNVLLFQMSQFVCRYTAASFKPRPPNFPSFAVLEKTEGDDARRHVIKFRLDTAGNRRVKELLKATDTKKNLKVKVTGEWTGSLAWSGQVVGPGKNPGSARVIITDEYRVLDVATLDEI
jgi:hypothetical protein